MRFDVPICRDFRRRAGSTRSDSWGVEVLRGASSGNKIPDLRGFLVGGSPLTDSNRRPPPYHGGALPTELRGRDPDCSPARTSAGRRIRTSEG